MIFFVRVRREVVRCSREVGWTAVEGLLRVEMMKWEARLLEPVGKSGLFCDAVMNVRSCA